MPLKTIVGNINSQPLNDNFSYLESNDTAIEQELTTHLADYEILKNATTGINRNALINGNFDIWQRGTSISGHGKYYADRWLEISNTDDTLTVTRENFTAGQTDVPNNPTYFLRASLTAGTTGTINDFRQRVEDVRTFAGQTVTLSYWIKGSIACSIASRGIRQNFGSGGSPVVSTTLPNLNVTTSWQKVEDTVTLPSISGKTIGTDHFLDVAIGLPKLTTVNIDIAQAQLCLGDTALPFQPRQIADELALCQRYYEKSFSLDTAPTQGAGAIGALQYRVANAGAVLAGAILKFGVQKRTAPTMIFYNPVSSNSKWYNVALAADSGASSTNDFNENGGYVSATQVAGDAVSNRIQIHWTADAEL